MFFRLGFWVFFFPFFFFGLLFFLQREIEENTSLEGTGVGPWGLFLPRLPAGLGQRKERSRARFGE